MNKKELAELIHRRKTGVATPDELQRLDAFWNELSNSQVNVPDHTAEELERVGDEIYQSIEAMITERSLDKKRLLWPREYWLRAAAVLFLISVSVWWYSSRNTMTEVRTAFGEHRTVVFPDQSSVVLNGNSVIRYSRSWDPGSIREVWIEGEGFFSVTHLENHEKFIVHSDEIIVEVFGTKFNVRARPHVSEVMLTEGKVKLDLAKNSEAIPLFLQPGEVATMDNKGLSKRVAQEQQFTSWVDNKLYFDRTPLKEIAQMLRETYGLELRFTDDSLQSKELSGEISSATEDDILFAISETFNFKFVREGRQVTVMEKSESRE